eukprot:gene1354-1494_t
MTSFKDFLEEIKLGHYWHMFEDEGYDDLDFISRFDDKDTAEMLDNVGIQKQGHRKKLESSLKIRKSLLSENNRNDPAIAKEKEPKKKEMPEPVKELLVPNPLIDKHVFYNETVEELFNASFPLMDINSFKSYALSQRQIRWKIKNVVQSIENVIVKYRESQDGIWINCRRFTNPEEVKCHIAKSLVMASGAKDAISKEIHKIEKEEKMLTNRRSLLFSSKNTVSSWKANELEFYDASLKKMSDTKSFLMRLGSQIQSVINKQEPNFPEHILSTQKKKMLRKRKLENDKKSEKRKEMRLFKSCGSVLGVITHDQLFCDDAARGKFQFQIEATSINPNAKDALKPKLHLRGLKHLIEKGVFADHDGSSKMAERLCNHLQKQLSATTETNKLKKAKRMKKHKYTKITECFQKAAMK